MCCLVSFVTTIACCLKDVMQIELFGGLIFLMESGFPSWIVFLLTEVFCSICPMVLLAAAVYFLVERRVAAKAVRSSGDDGTQSQARLGRWFQIHLSHFHPNKLPIYDTYIGVSLMNKDKFGHL